MEEGGWRRKSGLGDGRWEMGKEDGDKEWEIMVGEWVRWRW